MDFNNDGKYDWDDDAKLYNMAKSIEEAEENEKRNSKYSLGSIPGGQFVFGVITILLALFTDFFDELSFTLLYIIGGVIYLVIKGIRNIFR